MKLCIADPPYLGRGASLYGPDAQRFPSHVADGRPGTRLQSGDGNPAAAAWDDPMTHMDLVSDLLDRYDGWAIAMNPENLADYLQWVPVGTRIGAWVKPNPFPAGHVTRSWEPVLMCIPTRSGRRATPQVRDSLVVAANSGGNHGGTFIGAKPPAWTRWVLDMLGYDPETDTVDDLFAGSGAVANEIAQGVIDFGGAA